MVRRLPRQRPGRELFRLLVCCLQDFFAGGKLSKDALFLGLQAIAKMQRDGGLRCTITLREAGSTCVTVDGHMAGGALDISDHLYGIGALQTLHWYGFFNDIDASSFDRWLPLVRGAEQGVVEDHFMNNPDILFGREWGYDTPIHFGIDPAYVEDMLASANNEAASTWEASDVLEIKTR